MVNKTINLIQIFLPKNKLQNNTNLRSSFINNRFKNNISPRQNNVTSSYKKKKKVQISRVIFLTHNFT